MESNHIPGPAGTQGQGASQPAPAPAPQWQQPARRSLGRRVLLAVLGMLFVCSVMLNVFLAGLLAVQIDGGFRTTVTKEGSFQQTIAVYEVDGVITDRTARRFAAFCKEIEDDSNVKAVVLRVNSPGGGMSASDQIHHMVGRLRKQGKKIVVSMGAVAASGGYYISAGADEIVAEPTTVTGSIGVMMAWPVIRGTLEKIGIEAVVMKSSNARAWKDEGSILSMPNAHQAEHLQEILDIFQAKFEQIVRSGRGSKLVTRTNSYAVRAGDSEDAPERTVTETEPLNGKIYLSDQAARLGLIDAVGYLTEAIDRAARLAGLGQPRAVRYEARHSLLTEMLQNRRQALFALDVHGLDEIQTPRILLMWKVP